MESITAMIVDDHQLFREGMESLLKKLPYVSSIIQAGNGNEALDIIDKQAVHLIFMDIRMPELNGIDTTKMIRKKKHGTAIIALTMMEDPHSVVSMFKAGADGYLLKNTNFDELKEAIQTVLAGNRFYSKEISEILVDRIVVGAKTRPKITFVVKLTSREKEIVGLICRGFSSKDISEMLDIAIKTVETHRSNIYSKLSISNAADLVYYALQEGLVKRG
jgi:DNA-binding NarL/FixJ family response regulator